MVKNLMGNKNKINQGVLMEQNPFVNSESYKDFSIKFKAIVEQASNSDTTLFSNLLKGKTIEESLILEHYGYFQKNYNYAYHQAPLEQKGKIIISSIQESFFQHTFNQVLDNIILESAKDQKPISLNTQILLENTVEKFKLDLENVGINYFNNEKSPHDIIEENVYGFAAGAGALSLGAGMLPAIGISMITSFALALLMPASEMNKTNQFIGKWTGLIGRALTGSYNLWQTSFTPALGQSHQNILDFDNIDADPKVKELFRKIQKVHINEVTAQKGLTALSSECIHQNSNVLTLVEGPKNGLLDGLFTPNKYNILKLVIKAIFGKAETDKDDYDTLLRFRKCLANKLVDVYKLLLISNLQGKKDYGRILNTVTKANAERPEQLINFLPTETDEDKQLKEAILSLIMFRIHLTKLVKQLNDGFFEVDREASKFLEQKLKMVDSEVDQYLKLNRTKFNAPFEGKIMDKKPSLTKRSLLSQFSITK